MKGQNESAAHIHLTSQGSSPGGSTRSRTWPEWVASVRRSGGRVSAVPPQGLTDYRQIQPGIQHPTCRRFLRQGTEAQQKASKSGTAERRPPHACRLERFSSIRELSDAAVVRDLLRRSVSGRRLRVWATRVSSETAADASEDCRLCSRGVSGCTARRRNAPRRWCSLRGATAASAGGRPPSCSGQGCSHD